MPVTVGQEELGESCQSGGEGGIDEETNYC